MQEYEAGPTLAGRAVSAFPLSIGTSLAFESVFSPMQSPYDANRQIPAQVDVKNYQTCWINLSTLFRNLTGAITKEGFLAAHPRELAATLEEEMDVIQNLFQSEGQNLCKPVFYYSDYKKLKERNLPGLTFRENTTENQRFFHDRWLETVNLIEKHTDQIHFNKEFIIPSRRERAFCLTHQPYDLVGFDRFERLDLLESNTGVLKTRFQLNTKYATMSGQSFTHLPFTRKLLLVMGDRVLIKPIAALRKQVLETSLARHWTPSTTKDKISIDMGFDIRDPYAMSIFNSL